MGQNSDSARKELIKNRRVFADEINGAEWDLEGVTFLGDDGDGCACAFAPSSSLPSAKESKSRIPPCSAVQVVVFLLSSQEWEVYHNS